MMMKLSNGVHAMKLMSLFHSRPAPVQAYDRELKKPVIRCSICSGEQVAGFRNRQTGRFEEIMLLKTDRDLAVFMKRYGITETPEKIY